jgi:hypothetical protein
MDHLKQAVNKLNENWRPLVWMRFFVVSLSTAVLEFMPKCAPVFLDQNAKAFYASVIRI